VLILREAAREVVVSLPVHYDFSEDVRVVFRNHRLEIVVTIQTVDLSVNDRSSVLEYSNQDHFTTSHDLGKLSVLGADSVIDCVFFDG
jgi:hypothetical protein